MHTTKALGTDGFHAIFYQKIWDIIRGEVVMVVKKWWRGLFDLKHINKTCISLSLSAATQKTLAEYRPISYCNFIYKIISKTFANRLKAFFRDIISINQSAFISRRSITDNALLAFEAFHSMKRKANMRNNSLALKLDMSTTSDRVEWCFFERVILNLNFRGSWVRKVMSCITSVSFPIRSMEKFREILSPHGE